VGLVLAGCGYAVPQRREVQTVAVRVAGNETFRQRLELPLTRALQEALVVYGGYRPAARGEADAILEVTLEDGQNRALVTGRPEPLTEGSLTLVVRVRLLSLSQIEPLVDRKIVDRAEFRVAVGEGEADAIREAATDLARKIVLGLEADF
jgi:hypothetical protein